MASMIQNEISEIKDASIKAAKDKSDEWTLMVHWEKWTKTFEGAREEGKTNSFWKVQDYS